MQCLERLQQAEDFQVSAMSTSLPADPGAILLSQHHSPVAVVQGAGA